MKKLNLKTALVIAFTISLSITSFSQQKLDHSKMNMNHKKGMVKGKMMMQKVGETHARTGDKGDGLIYVNNVESKTRIRDEK
ncbi:MAG: hypothetical protein QM495_08820 [Lutibacter sp.]|uniref:hypothetical protein n=1 Tax=Lutibacter sp. TaxID=1925666 RepID=UPI00385A4A7D